MTTFNTNTDLNARGRQMLKAREAAETQVWRLVDLLPALVARMAPNPEREIAKAARREAARRAVDNLLR
jgi:hypothetical protein